MQVDKTIKGAADKITGLLNPQEGQSEPEKKQTEPQEQTQEKPVQETAPDVVEEVSKSETEEAKPETDSSEITETEQTEQQEAQEPSLHRVKVQGQELEVSLDELKSGYSRDSDYRQKTHALSQDKKTLDDQRMSLSQTYDSKLKELNDLIGMASNYISQPSNDADLKKMYDEDPANAAKIDFEMRQQRESFNKLRSQSEALKAQQYNQYIEEQKTLAATKIPEYSDPNKAVNFKNQMKQSLSEYGFNEQEIGSLADHRFLMVLRDAMGYKASKAAPVTNKKVTTAPRVIKSGTPKMEDSKRATVKQKIGRLRKSGKLNDAHSAILEIISKNK